MTFTLVILYVLILIQINLLLFSLCTLTQSSVSYWLQIVLFNASPVAKLLFNLLVCSTYLWRGLYGQELYGICPLSFPSVNYLS